MDSSELRSAGNVPRREQLTPVLWVSDFKTRGSTRDLPSEVPHHVHVAARRVHSLRRAVPYPR
jgi:hypothetical protein